jgi:hypothetical protein
MGIAPTSQPYLIPMFSSRTITSKTTSFSPHLQMVKHLVIVMAPTLIRSLCGRQSFLLRITCTDGLKTSTSVCRMG